MRDDGRTRPSSPIRRVTDGHYCLQSVYQLEHFPVGMFQLIARVAVLIVVALICGAGYHISLRVLL